MKMVPAFWIALRIEYHWRKIAHYKKTGLRLIAAGEPFTSGRIIALTGKIDHHGMVTFQLEKQYAEMTGTAS